jgi:hypothetical protein
VYIGFWWGKPTDRKHLEDPGVDGKITFMKVRNLEVLAWVRGQGKMGQVLGVFELLDFTMLRPFLALWAF